MYLVFIRTKAQIKTSNAHLISNANQKQLQRTQAKNRSLKVYKKILNNKL